jgi:hypothetical protein
MTYGFTNNGFCRIINYWEQCARGIMDVTWDTEKNQKNIKKRHLPLSLGGLVLDDEMRIERHD